MPEQDDQPKPEQPANRIIQLIQEAGLDEALTATLVDFCTKNQLNVHGVKFLTVDILLSSGLLLGPALALMEISRKRMRLKKK